MDSRYLRATSPSRRYGGQSARNSTGHSELHPTYDSYGNPVETRDQFTGPRSSAERIVNRAAPRLRLENIPIRRGPDDWDIPPRRIEPVRRTVVAPPSPSRYQPVVSSATDIPSQNYPKARPREDESYYIQPAASSRRDVHNRHLSIDKANTERYVGTGRTDRDRAERGGYRSTGVGGSRKQYHNIPQVRPPRDKDDHDFGYEYTDFKEQAYRDTAPRPRVRRGSDAGVVTKERPHSITGLEEYLQPRAPRPARDGYARDGPPVSTRGFSKIDRNGSVRHEYRYPRDTASGDEDDGLTRNKSIHDKPTRTPVSLHQDKHDGSSADDRGLDKTRRRHRAESIDRSKDDRGDRELVTRHRTESIDKLKDDRGPVPRHRAESIDRPKDDRVAAARYPKQDDDPRREKDRPQRLDANPAESRDRSHRQHKHTRDESQDRYKSENGRRDRGDESERDRRPRDRADEPARDYKPRDRGGEYDRKRDDKKSKHDSHLGEGVALGAAGAAAAGLLGVKHRRDKEKADVDQSAARDRASRDAVPDPSEISSPSSNSDEERRERRRRRRKDREERARLEVAALAPQADTKSVPRDHGGEYPPPNDNLDPEDAVRRRRHRRGPSSGHSSSDSSDDRPTGQRRVRVVSPTREPEIKPKGILRPPREKFPEDPTPIREGVAPLKDAGKKGIPVNARWTKIDRKLVNPEALVMGNERFEERLDYVIVLRVLSKEEIEQYANKTSEIREARQSGTQRRHHEVPDYDDEFDDDSYEEERPRPRAIEDHAYNDNGPDNSREHERRNPYNNVQAVPGSAAPGLPLPIPANGPDTDPNRPGLNSSGSYHRVAPGPHSSSTSMASSATYPPPSLASSVTYAAPSSTTSSGTYPPPSSTTSSSTYPPPPPQQYQPPVGGYVPQAPVTGEYTALGYPPPPPPPPPGGPYGQSGLPGGFPTPMGQQAAPMPWKSHVQGKSQGLGLGQEEPMPILRPQ